jgi:hypothetical protein
MGSNLHFFRYATTTGSDGGDDAARDREHAAHVKGGKNHGKLEPEWQTKYGKPPVGDPMRRPPTDQHSGSTGGTVPVSRAHGLGLSFRRDRDLAPELVDDDSRFYTWIWRELVDRGLLDLVVRLAVR